MQKNRVSIVIPTYKRPNMLDRLLFSIKQQTFQDFEIVIIDDASPNQAEYQTVVEKYRPVFDEFNYFRNETNRGAPYSRNRGIRNTKYPLVALVDDDDEWLPKKLEKQVAQFARSKTTLDIVYTWMDSIDQNGQKSYLYRSQITGNAKKEILTDCFIPSSSVMVRKDAIINAGLFDEKFPSCQDWDMWTRMILQGCYVRVVEEVLTIHYLHDNTIGNSKRAMLGYFKYYKKHMLNSLRHGCVFNILKFFLYSWRNRWTLFSEGL